MQLDGGGKTLHERDETGLYFILSDNNQNHDIQYAMCLVSCQYVISTNFVSQKWSLFLWNIGATTLEQVILEGGH